MDNRAEVGDFLRRRREMLTVADVGLAVGVRRRTPGLRRDEVAEIAGISAVYYERLEQGRGPKPSASVLAGLARALRLTADEQDHVYRLAGHAPPARPDCDGFIDPSLEYVLQAVQDTTPGFIADDLGYVVAQNWLNVELFGTVAGLPRHGANLVWLWFTSARWRALLEPPEQHEATSMAYVADLRGAVARREHDAAAAALVADLRSASAEFASVWDRHPVAALHCPTKVVHDPRVGQIDLDCSVVTSPLSQQRLLLMHPMPGTPSQERLARLSTYRQYVDSPVPSP
jgi:transcriptional regulator with XRE-family HTH domain